MTLPRLATPLQAVFTRFAGASFFVSNLYHYPAFSLRVVSYRRCGFFRLKTPDIPRLSAFYAVVSDPSAPCYLIMKPMVSWCLRPERASRFSVGRSPTTRPAIIMSPVRAARIICKGVRRMRAALSRAHFYGGTYRRALPCAKSGCPFRAENTHKIIEKILFWDYVSAYGAKPYVGVG